MNASIRKTIVLSIFCVAMAALEAAVVVYLRALYYPEEFTVAFKIIHEKILGVEIVREVATLVMLWGAAYLAGKNWIERFAYFLLSFAVWDIFYYLWLKVFIDWPTSFLDWDILFLVPITWIGPVGAPLICAVTMIVFAFLLLKANPDQVFSKTIWTCLIAGIFLILFTFLKDYGELIIANGFVSDYPNFIQNPDFIAIASTYMPQPYSWNIFWAGELLIIMGIVIFSMNKHPQVDYEKAKD